MTPKSAARRIGLARALCKRGYCSRSQAVELIRASRVRLNGVVRRGPETPVNLDKDRIEVDGAPISAGRALYLMLNKPRGAVTTASDERGRQTVYSFLPERMPWLAPVGRLDKASEGLLLFTNDSEWAARVLAPETHLQKTYHAQVAAIVDDALAQSLMQGVHSRGDFLQATRARVLRRGKRNSWLEVVLHEGKNRQVRRMLEQLGLEVLRLLRVAVGPLALGELTKGSVRALTADEISALDQAMRPLSRQQSAPPGRS